MKKGVYVENLTEYNVRNVSDVVKLLLQVGQDEILHSSITNYILGV